MILKHCIAIISLMVALVGCISKERMDESMAMADEKFGDQHFKTAISLIELHKVRYGQYPDSLSQLTYLGEFDPVAFASVKYEKLPDGYALDLKGMFTGKPLALDYPAKFWNGLGLKRSNVKH